MTDPLVQQFEQIVPDLINMVVALEAPELAVVAKLVEALGVAVTEQIASGRVDLRDGILAADAAALAALHLKFNVK